MSASDKYLQFPLCALAFCPDAKDCLEHIISYGFIEAGASVVRSADTEKLKELCSCHSLPKTMYKSWDLAAEIGAGMCGITIGSRECSLKRHSALASHLGEWEKRYGKDGSVRVRKDLCFEVRDKDGMTFREFRVLCAIYSSIGSKSCPVAIPVRMIDARVCGCKSEAVLEAELVCHKEKLPPRLTQKQLRGTIRKLHELGWFARCTPDPHGRKTFYSHRLRDDEMRDRLFKRATYSHTFKHEQRLKDSELSERIKAAKGTFNRQQNASKEGQLEGTPESAESQCHGDGKGNGRAPIIETLEIQTHAIINPKNENPPNEGRAREGDYLLEAQEIVKGTNAAGSPERGYLFEGRFLSAPAANALFTQMPEEWQKFKSAFRFEDGRIELAV